jgi:hypothetical protein
MFMFMFVMQLKKNQVSQIFKLVMNFLQWGNLGVKLALINKCHKLMVTISHM